MIIDDIKHYRKLLETILEQPEDDVPELPDDEELDKLKLNTMIKLGKLPKWWQGFNIHQDEFSQELEGSWTVEGRWPVPDNNFITLLYVLPIGVGANSLVAVLENPIDKIEPATHPQLTRDIEKTVNNILKDFGFKSRARFLNGVKNLEDYEYFFRSSIGTEIANFYKKNFLKDNTKHRDIEQGIIREADDDIPELPSDDELDKIKLNTMIKLGKLPKWYKHIKIDNGDVEISIRTHITIDDCYTAREFRYIVKSTDYGNFAGNWLLELNYDDDCDDPQETRLEEVANELLSGIFKKPINDAHFEEWTDLSTVVISSKSTKNEIENWNTLLLNK